MKKRFAIRVLAILVGMGGMFVNPLPLTTSIAIAQQQEDQAAARLQSLFDAKSIDSKWFTPEFLKQVPAAQVEQIIVQVKTAFGTPTAMKISDGNGVISFKDARMPVRIGFDRQGRIEMLWFGPPQQENASLENLVRNINDTAVGDASVFVSIDGEPVVDQNSDRPMAVGSAFKLVVLKAYEDAIKAGELKRDQVTLLKDDHRSLPSGTLQMLPADTPVTLELLAQLMIRISDNTATDNLFHELGRAKMQALSQRNTPFLDTGEFFQLIASGAEEMRGRYKTGSPQERLRLLSDLSAEPLPETDKIGRSITWREIEWHMTAKEICTLLGDLKGAPALNGSFQPLFASLNWPKIGFKGGSERGVLNLSAIGMTGDGQEICAVFTANGDGPQPEGRITPLFVDMLRAAEKLKTLTN